MTLLKKLRCKNCEDMIFGKNIMPKPGEVALIKMFYQTSIYNYNL